MRPNVHRWTHHACWCVSTWGKAGLVFWASQRAAGCWGRGMPLRCSSCSATVLGTDRGAEHISGTFRGREAKWDAETWLLSEPLLFVPAQEGRALRNLLKQRLRGAAFKQRG